jgi:uncharacterized protein (TIGR02145 family)
MNGLMILYLSFLLPDIPGNTSFCQQIMDERDGKLYRTVQIGRQCWMAENLNVGKEVYDFHQNNNKIIEKTCYDNDSINCRIYGGLYTWDEAMAYNPTVSTGICPAGWHIPGIKEWEELSAFLGEEVAGEKMKVAGNYFPSWDGTNESGFTAYPSGCGHDTVFSRQGHWAVYWSSSETDSQYADFVQLDRYWAPGKYRNLITGNYYLKSSGFSIRCLKNSHSCTNPSDP